LNKNSREKDMEEDKGEIAEGEERKAEFL